MKEKERERGFTQKNSSPCSMTDDKELDESVLKGKKSHYSLLLTMEDE